MTRQDIRSAYGYARVSTLEQGVSGAGLDAQREAIRQAAASRGWKLTALRCDVMSGKTAERTALAKLLDDLKSRRADAIIVSKLDRLTRSLADFTTILERSRKEGWAIVALDFDLDTSTPTGELVANIMVSVAQWERRMIAQRTKEALAIKMAQGVRVGRPRQIGSHVEAEVKRMRAQGMFWNQIGAQLGIPWTSARRVGERK